MKKRLLSMILAISMVLTFLPVSAITAFAANNGTCGDGLTWSMDEDGVVTITGTEEGTGVMTDYDLNQNRAPWSGYYPSNVKGIVFKGKVTSIGEQAFYGCSNVISVTIPASVTSIGERAFEGAGLTSLKIPSTVTSVGEYAFRNCSSLDDLTIENSVISKGEFNNCTSLTEVTIPGSVDTIGERAFSECSSLGTVTIENGVTTIGESAFQCDLTKDTNGHYVGVSTPLSVTVPDSVTSIGASAFYGRAGLTSINLPSNITTISNSAFGQTGLTEVEIPNKVESIGKGAFSSCANLKKVVIPASVQTIGQSAFSGCTSLATVNIPSGVNQINDYTFYGCTSLESITIPASVKNIYESAFAGAGLKNLVVPEGVISLGPGVFARCPNLETVKLPNSLKTFTQFPSGTFEGCPKLWKVEFENPGNLSILDNYIFRDCVKLTDVSLPSSLTQIRAKTFKGCNSLEKIDLPENVSSIGRAAFQDCISLRTVTIPQPSDRSYCPSISSDAFKGCKNLEKIYYKGTFTNIKNYPQNITGLTVLETGDTQIVYDGQTPIDLVYQCNVEFYAKADNSSYYSHMYGKDVSVYRNETVASDKAPTLPEKDGYTLHWHVDSADGEEFVLGEAPVAKDTSLYAVYTLKTKGVTVSPGVTVKDADGNTIAPDGSGKVSVTPGQEITLSPTTKTEGDAYEWTISEKGKTDSETRTDDSITITVNDETEIKLETLKALHITTDGEPNTDGTKYDADKNTYYGNGWEYSKNDGLTIKETKDLSNEPAVTVKVTVETGKTLSNAKLEGSVTNNGTLSNCVLDKAPTGTGSVKNSLFGTEYTGAKTLTEADGKKITAALKDVKDGSLTGETLWFVGTPELTATVENNTAIKHINHDDVKASKVTGVKGTVETDNADNSVTFTPDGTENILLNNRTAVTGDFTFTTPKDCTYDGNAHKVEDINSTTYTDGEYTVKYDYKNPGWKEGDPVDKVTEAKDAGTYTVKIVMSDGQTIDTGKSFTISPAKPGENDFEFVKKLPSGVTEDRDDSEKTAEVQLKSDSLFNADHSTVTTKYQKKNANGDWEKVTAPSGKGEYRLVATVTPKDTTNLSKGTVVWEFTILDREDANWLTMSVEDGKITKVTRPAADDAEAEDDITEKVLLTASADGSKTAYKVPAGAQVTVTANDAPQDMKFEMWRFSVNSMNGDTALALYSRSMTFTLKDDFAGLTVSAMYQDAAIDSGYDILGPAAAATTAVVGSAILAYQGHMLGTELYLIYLLPSGAVIPANRIQLAMLLWQDAGNPAPVDETPYSDIDSGDTDAMQAAQWAVETGLMELPDADNAPDQFDPYAAVSNVDVIHAWKKAQKVKG